MLAASKLVLLSLTDYDAMYQILRPATDALESRVLVNLSSDTPEKAREAAQWAAEHGAEYLAGGVMVPPPLVGKPEAYVFYSGNQDLFETYQPMLEILGKTDYRGSDPGLALLFYQALLDIMFTSAADMAHVAHASRDANINTTLPNAIKEIFDETVAHGYGKDGLTSIIEVHKKPSE